MLRFPDTGEIMRLSVDSAMSSSVARQRYSRATRHNRSCLILPDTQWRDHRDVPVARRPQDVGHGFDECARPGVEFRTRSASSITCTRANSRSSRALSISGVTRCARSPVISRMGWGRCEFGKFGPSRGDCPCRGVCGLLSSWRAVIVDVWFVRGAKSKRGLRLSLVSSEGVHREYVVNGGESWAVVLAAGSGTRFGGHTQFADLAGLPMLNHAVRSAGTACDGVVVVLPADCHDCWTAPAGCDRWREA